MGLRSTVRFWYRFRNSSIQKSTNDVGFSQPIKMYLTWTRFKHQVYDMALVGDVYLIYFQRYSELNTCPVKTRALGEFDNNVVILYCVGNREIIGWKSKILNDAGIYFSKNIKC